MDDKHDYSQAMGSYMAGRLEEAIRSAKRRSGGGSGSQTPENQEQQNSTSQGLPRSKRHDEKMASDREEEDRKEQYDQPLCKRRRPQTPLAPPPPPTTESISTDDGSAILVDDDDDYNEDAISPHTLSPYTQRNYHPTIISNQASNTNHQISSQSTHGQEQDSNDDLPWSTRTDADIEARLERLPMNRRRTPETYRTGKEMVEEHVLSVEEFKIRTRDRLGLRASGEQRAWSVS